MIQRVLVVTGPSTGRVIARLAKIDGEVVVQEACSREVKEELRSMLLEDALSSHEDALRRMASALRDEFGFVAEIRGDKEDELVNNACHHDRSPPLAHQEG